MRNTIIYAVVIFGALAVAQAAIKQEGMYNCGGAKQLGTPSSSNCCQLCYCLGSQNKMYSAAGIQNICKQQCNKCVVAANDGKQCPNANSPLPSACSQGLSFNAQVKSLMDKCAAMYQRDPASLRKVPGC